MLCNVLIHLCGDNPRRAHARDISSLRTKAKDTCELATGRLGITKSNRQRQRDDKHALDCYAATQHEQWRRGAVQYVAGALRFLTTVIWDDDYMR